MSCLTPGTKLNPKYLPSVKNGGFPPACPDERLRYIQFDCGRCVECLRTRATHWRFRLSREYRYSDLKKFHFVTLTFSDDSLDFLSSELMNDPDYEYINEDSHLNDIATIAVRRFLERNRKFYKVSLRHFFVTERGSKDGRIHLHGIIIDCKCGQWRNNKFFADLDVFNSIWQYGFTWFGWCNDRTINYIVKYIMKRDEVHPDFKSKLLLSPGIGRAYVNPITINYHHSGDFIWYCLTDTGHKISMPRYYRLKIFTEREREKRVLQLLNNPPPKTFKGRTFETDYHYRTFILAYYANSIRVGASYHPVGRSLDLNKNYSVNFGNPDFFTYTCPF